VTDLIDRESVGEDPRLAKPRSVSLVKELGAAWPHVERRRGPRRRTAGDRAFGRRVGDAPLDRVGVPALDPLSADMPATLGEAAAVRPRVRDRHVRPYRRAVLAIDIAAASIGAEIAYIARFGMSDQTRNQLYVWGGLALPMLWLLCIAASRAYEARFLATSAEEYRRLVNAGLVMIAGIAVVSYLAKAEFARGYIVAAAPLSIALSALGRHVARRVLRRARANGRCLQDVLLVGHEWSVLDMVAELKREPDCGLRVVGACLPGGRGSLQMGQAGIPVVGSLETVVESVRKVNADVVAVTTCVEFGAPELRKVAWALETSNVEIVVAPAVMEIAGPRVHIRPVVGLPLLHIEKPEFTGVRRIVKGIFDRVVASLALLVLAPLFVAVALAIRLTSAGPSLFRQTRIGARGKPFTLYKFRSMYVGAEAAVDALRDANVNDDGLLFKVRRDPRVTTVGRYLRRYSIDELPQLLNVVLGHMSLVGPRPPLPREVEMYADDVRRRLLVRPGVTGLWQVSGRSDLSWEESVRLDLRYVENWSLVYDFQILLKTVYAVVKGVGAY
jgi:exopolysaccharide biosynthesis polyprenyl glycosylphosphotransferase